MFRVAWVEHDVMRRRDVWRKGSPRQRRGARPHATRFASRETRANRRIGVEEDARVAPGTGCLQGRQTCSRGVVEGRAGGFV